MTDDDSDQREAWAYDPVANEDVRIGNCRSAHRSTEPEDIDGEELPVLVESDFRHDPVEGCQGSYTVITEIGGDGCPVCGYDRMTVAHLTLPGEHFETCIACETDITMMER